MTNDVKQAIDWSKPIEAVHEEAGVGYPAAWRHVHNQRLAAFNGNCLICDDDGALNFGWRIRNVTPAAPESTIPAALVERCVGLVRRMSGNSSVGEPYEEDRVITYSSDHYCEARAIVADPGFPVEVDEDLVDEELVEVVANALRDPIQRDNELYWAAEYGRPVPQDSPWHTPPDPYGLWCSDRLATAAINAIREWEGR